MLPKEDSDPWSWLWKDYVDRTCPDISGLTSEAMCLGKEAFFLQLEREGSLSLNLDSNLTLRPLSLDRSSRWWKAYYIKVQAIFQEVAVWVHCAFVYSRKYSLFQDNHSNKSFSYANIKQSPSLDKRCLSGSKGENCLVAKGCLCWRQYCIYFPREKSCVTLANRCVLVAFWVFLLKKHWLTMKELFGEIWWDSGHKQSCLKAKWPRVSPSRGEGPHHGTCFALAFWGTMVWGRLGENSGHQDDGKEPSRGLVSKDQGKARQGRGPQTLPMLHGFCGWHTGLESHMQKELDHERGWHNQSGHLEKFWKRFSHQRDSLPRWTLRSFHSMSIMTF